MNLHQAERIWQANQRLEADRALRQRIVGDTFAKRHAAGKLGWSRRKARG